MLIPIYVAYVFQDPLYLCFLKYDAGSNEEQDPARIDTAKLHCCEKAESEQCGSLCVKVSVAPCVSRSVWLHVCQGQWSFLCVKFSVATCVSRSVRLPVCQGQCSSLCVKFNVAPFVSRSPWLPVCQGQCHSRCVKVSVAPCLSR